MTVSINRDNYLTKDEIKTYLIADMLSQRIPGIITWRKYTGDDWNTQLVKPKKKLEDITGKPVTYLPILLLME
jgi:hypothetical protein